MDLVLWISPKCGQGGVKNPENFVDVLNGSPLSGGRGVRSRSPSPLGLHAWLGVFARQACAAMKEEGRGRKAAVSTELGEKEGSRLRECCRRSQA